MKIFTEKFLSIQNSKISKEILEKGFFKVENALTPEFLSSIENDVESCGLSLNNNYVSGVYFTHGNQFFLTHMLAASKSFYEYCTNPKVIAFFKEYFGSSFTLKALRYYENFGGQNMMWHTDNRSYEKLKKKETHITSPGIIFLAYISDVEDGEFQYVKGSHTWAGKNLYHDYNAGYIEKNYANDIIGFKGKKGDLLIYNAWGVHRAKPTKSKVFVRKTLFFQVEKETNYREPILLNSEFISDVSEDLKMYLGFGKKATNKVYPYTDIYTMPFNKRVSFILYKWILSRILLSLPGFIRKKVRNYYNIPTNKI